MSIPAILKWAGSFLLLLVLLVSELPAASSVNVPLDHWSYEALEKLDGFGLIRSDLQGSRPFTRMEVGRLVNEAIVTLEGSKKDVPQLVQDLLERFKCEFKEELDSWSDTRVAPARSFFKPVDEAQVRYVYVNGEPRRFNGYKDSKYTIDATEGTPLVHNNEGVVYSEGSNFTLQFSSTFRLMNNLSGYVEPLLLVRENATDGEGADARVELLKGYGKLSLWDLDIQAGRDSLWWGQGRHGDLLLTNNAAPIDMVKMTNPVPTLFPWYFGYLGPSRFTFFLGRLEDFRVNIGTINKPEYIETDVGLTGLKVSVKPLPYFEMGFGTTFLFGGEGRPGLSFLDFVETLFLLPGRSQEAAGKVDQMAAFDFRIQLPFLCNAELYGEYAGEDSGGLKYPEELLLGDVAYLVGIYFPRLTADGRADLRVEFANTAHRVDSSPAFWYGHFAYSSGYTHDRMIMGHHMDGDAMDFFARVTYYLGSNVKLGLDYDHMERGITLNPVQEYVNEYGIDVVYDFNDHLSFGARFGYCSTLNFDLVDGDDRDSQLLMTTVKWRF